METVYKYKIELQDEQIVKLPRGVKILNVDTQDSEIFIWALVDTERDLREIKILIRGTGHEIISCINKKYIGTIQLLGGKLIYHIFEIID